MLRLALVLSVALFTAACDTDTDQELNSLRIGLRDYGIVLTNEELAELSPQQRAELFGTLTSTSNFRNQGWLRTRQRLLTILSREPSTA